MFAARDTSDPPYINYIFTTTVPAIKSPKRQRDLKKINTQSIMPSGNVTFLKKKR